MDLESRAIWTVGVGVLSVGLGWGLIGVGGWLMELTGLLMVAGAAFSVAALTVAYGVKWGIESTRRQSQGSERVSPPPPS